MKPYHEIPKMFCEGICLRTKMRGVQTPFFLNHSTSILLHFSILSKMPDLYFPYRWDTLAIQRK